MIVSLSPLQAHHFAEPQLRLSSPPFFFFFFFYNFFFLNFNLNAVVWLDDHFLFSAFEVFVLTKRVL